MSISIRPISAHLNKDTDLIGKMDPYVVCILGQEKKSTQKSKGLNPTWSETLHFNGGSDKLLIQVWDKDRFSSDDLLGRASFDLTKLHQHKMPSEIQVQLEEKGEAKGSLKLEIMWAQGSSPGNQYNQSGWGSQFGQN